VFYYFYLISATFLYVVAAPVLLLLSFKQKYKKSIPARFFLIGNKKLKSNGIHFHVCSFGEAKAIEPIIKKLDSEILRFSAITNTGFSVIKSYSNEASYLPFEIFLPFWINRQKALVVVEAELWYALFKVYKNKNAKTFLINARISQNSYKKYLKFKWFYKKIFSNIDFVYAQSKDDAKRLKELGAKNIKVIGNIKFCNIKGANKNYAKTKDIVITAASTHEGEEELILKAYLKFAKKNKNSQLIIVPRHPERFNKVKKLLKEYNLDFASFSQDKSFKKDIILVDVLGELINIYAISDIVILGGAFSKIGGHNAAEAAQFGCKIISGEHYFNQKDIFKSIKNIKIIKSEDLAKTLLNYKELKSCKIDTNVDISELIEDIKDVLRDKE
jgi:3-deoxy-D-manno-octulosonic-acid transferase